MEIPVADLAYMCGIFDGEGTLNLRRASNNSLPIRAAVYNTDISVMTLFPLYFKGSIYAVMDKRPVNKPHLSMWYCPRDGIVFFAQQMLKFCREREKREKLELVIKYADLVQGVVGTNDLSQEIRYFRTKLLEGYLDIVTRYKKQSVIKETLTA